jgi:hypothetical protein
MTTEEQNQLLLAAVLRDQMILMIGLAELLEGIHPWAKSSRNAAQMLRARHEQTRQLIQTLKS